MSDDHHLTESNKSFLAAIVQSFDDAVIGKTLDGTITSWNRAAEQMYGYTAAEMIGQHVSKLGGSEQQCEFRAILCAIADGRTVRQPQVKRIRKDGRRIDVKLTVSPVKDGEGNVVGAATVARDISAGFDLEQQLLRSQRLEAFGLIAGGVAHDCNNLIMLGENYAFLLKANKAHAAEVERFADLVGGTLKKAALIVRQLLEFGRKQVREVSVTSLNVIGAAISDMLAHLRIDKVTVATALNSTGTVRVDINEIEQLVLNLAINARDAMPNGGTLTIATDDVFLHETKRSDGAEIPPGRYQVLSVSDTGAGMDEETKNRMFEPFFSTKPAQKGTGLGLSTVQAIAKRYEAHLAVHSTLGRGTCIEVYFAENEDAPAA